MIERRQRIPAEEVVDPKSWNLPFWVEPEALVKAREKEEAQEQLEAEAEVEEEELEVEPLTAEQLEQIRQEAYNEGLEQGLVEGRQKGEKLGTQEGRKEGLATGTQEGHKLGLEAGKAEGQKKALEKSDKETKQTIAHLESVITVLTDQMTSQKVAIENLLPELVEMLAQAVIHEELSQGSEHIVALVNLAIEALPLDKSDLTVEINEKDLPFLEASFQRNNIEVKVNTNGNISPGGCQLVTDKSVADFTLQDRWEEVIKQYKNQLEIGLLQDTSGQEEPEEAEEQLADAQPPVNLEEPESLNQSEEASSEKPSTNDSSSTPSPKNNTQNTDAHQSSG